MPTQRVIPSERIEKYIYFVRGRKIMIDSDLARLYNVATKALVQAVKRNVERFPEDFMFQLNQSEAELMRSQSVTALKRNIRYLPYAFTQEGVSMLSSVLKSKRAIQVNITIMRVFVRLRAILSTHKDLARKLEELEKKYDTQFKQVFDAIRRLMSEPPKIPESKPIGFRK